LLFHSLDNKKECYKIYRDGSLIEGVDELCTHTWAPTPHLQDETVEYAQLWCSGKSMTEVCPEELRARFEHINTRAMVFLRTFHNAKVNLDDVCFYDLVPEKFLLDFCEIKNDITEYVFENYTKPENYEFMRDLIFLLKKIETKNVNIDTSLIGKISNSARMGLNKLRTGNTRIVYNPWKTVTGRLTTDRHSFPILTMNKELRTCIKPQNDVFVELDYNAAELRVLLGLLEQKQPEQDLHTWISESVFDNKFDRETTKKKVFSWLYNPKARNKKLNERFCRQEILSKFHRDGSVITPYSRTIPVGEDKALNYLIQSTSSDMLLNSAIKLDKVLGGRKSFISFCIHDSVVLDMSSEDRELLTQCISEFSSTKFGKIKTNISLGKNFGQMRDIA